MDILFSVPSGYHLRELVLPLKNYIEADTSIEHVYVVTPAAEVSDQVFAGFSEKFSYHENPMNIAEHEALMKKLAPDIIITNTVGHDERDYPILKAAVNCNLPTLTFIASWDNVWKIDRLLKASARIHIADSFIVWNEMMKKHLHRLFPELSTNSVAIIGAPRLDYFWRTQDIPSREAIYQLLGFSDITKPFIHFSTTELYPMDYIVEAVAHAIDRGALPDMYLYASVHPGGDMQKHAKLKQFGTTVKYSPGRIPNPPHPSFAYIPTEIDILNLVGMFRHAAILINHSSTTALESLIAGVPVINVKYGQRFDWWHWYRSMVYRDFKQHYVDLLRDNASYQVGSRQELIAAASLALQQPGAKDVAAKKTVARMITTTDGTAGKKVLTEIKNRAKKA